jgi:hypothetical protein
MRLKTRILTFKRSYFSMHSSFVANNFQLRHHEH